MYQDYACFQSVIRRQVLFLFIQVVSLVLMLSQNPASQKIISYFDENYYIRAFINGTALFGILITYS